LTAAVASRRGAGARYDVLVSPTEPLIRNVSDTARWAAVYRARESARPDALFHDPFAARLAEERGERIAALPGQERNTWAWVMRTYLFDRFLAAEIEEGADMVVNLAAGLDARPYRMALPAPLRWVEVDLPELLADKEEVLRGERPACALERVPLDLADVAARRALFARLGSAAKRAVILSEGLLIYLAPDEVGALATDLAAPPSFARWICDLASPGLVRMLGKQVGAQLDQARAPLRFGPAEGPAFFERFGWEPAAVASLFRAAVRTRRLPWPLRLFALLPESNGRQGSRPWSGVCLLRKRER
jgi:methyltransferase (TIGR00027 family)